jgi:hypothetical protein
VGTCAIRDELHAAPGITPAAGTAAGSDHAAAGMSVTIQCVNPPSSGASGSCTMSTNDFVVAGTPVQESAGDVPSLLQECLTGMAPSFVKASLVRASVDGARVLTAVAVAVAGRAVLVAVAAAFVAPLVVGIASAPSSPPPLRQAQNIAT